MTEIDSQFIACWRQMNNTINDNEFFMFFFSFVSLSLWAGNVPGTTAMGKQPLSGKPVKTFIHFHDAFHVINK